MNQISDPFHRRPAYRQSQAPRQNAIGTFFPEHIPTRLRVFLAKLALVQLS